MYFIGVTIMLFGTTMLCYFKGVPLSLLFNAPLILAIFITIAGVIAGTSSFKIFIRGLNAVFSKRYVIEDSQRNKALELFRLLSKSVMAVSVFSFFISIVASLADLSNIETLGYNLSAALTSLPIGIIVSLFFFEPAALILKKPRIKSERVKVYPKHTGDKLLELCSQYGITPEDIQNAKGIYLTRD